MTISKWVSAFHNQQTQTSYGDDFKVWSHPFQSHPFQSQIMQNGHKSQLKSGDRIEPS